MQNMIEKYGIAEMVNVEGQEVPLINLPQMSDDEWNRLARQQKQLQKDIA